jgi:PmbA protein
MSDAIVMEELIDVSDYLLKRLKEKGAEDVVLHASLSFGQQLKFANSKIVKTGTERTKGIGVFSTIEKKVIETTIKEPTKKRADEVVNNIFKFSKYIPKNKEYFGIAEGKFKYKNLPYDSKIEKLGDKSVDIIEDAINIASREGAKRSSGVFEVSNYESYLTTSNNISAKEKGSGIYFSIRSFISKESSGHRVVCGRKLGLDFNKAAEESAVIAKNSANPIQGPVGKFNVLFDPLPFANFLERVGDAASIFQLEAGLSFLQDKLGKMVANKNVTIIDDGSLPGGYHSSAFDAEGVPTRENKIIEDGKFKMYLHNTSTAKKYKTKTTGNAGLIAPHPWNIILEKGNLKNEEMLTELRNGIYVSNVWYTRFQNFVTGDFSTIPRDGLFIIKNGEISQPIRNVRISENILNILQNIVSVGKDVKNIHSWEVEASVITAPVIVKNVNITKPLV